MQSFTLRTSLAGFVLGIALALALSLSSAQADAALPPMTGSFTSVGLNGPLPDGTLAIIAPSSPAAGALVYEDFKLIEAKARKLLQDNLSFREAISPYGKKADFDTLVNKFDYNAGFSRTIPENGNIYHGKTIEQAIEQANRDLLQARDLYAYLAVYAPEARFRADDGYTKNIPSSATQSLCGETDKENPDPVAPTTPPTAEVQPPVIDWCNFTARLRQSVREAANIRMVFAQQFVADALGLHFSGVDFYGGEAFVRDEVAKLRLAQYQYAQAEQGLAGALGRSLGNGCFVSDFYTQAEWSLLSRAAEGQETTQHHIGIRESYLDISQPSDVPHAQAAAQTTFRSASVDGYIKLIGMASLGNTQPLTAGCSKGARPDSLLVAEMAVNMLKTRKVAHELADGRNIFGFDVMFTPARPYRTAPNSPDRGLWNEAESAAQYAKELQNDDVAASRAFDSSQSDLLKAVEGIRGTINKDIAAQSGCSRSDFADDSAWLACIDQQSTALKQCLGYVLEPDTVSQTPIPGITTFDQCINQPVIKTSDAKRMLIDLRTVKLQMTATTKRAQNINARVLNSNDRNVTVKNWLQKKGDLETAARASQSALDAIACVDTDNDLSVGAKAKMASCGTAGATDVALQSSAGAISTQADVAIDDAEHHKEVANLLLDQSELLIDQYAAMQQFQSKKTEFDGLLGDLQSNVVEAQRQRQYLNLSPGNDPSFRIVRDSARIVLAKQLEYAARVSYLAARRAEYEYAARLAASNFRISDIYRARTADDILRFLQNLASVTDNLAGSVSDAQINPADFKVSVALHVLGLTDAALAQAGFTSPAAAQVERTHRFRLWVAQNMQTGSDGKPQLKFSFTTSVLDKGIFSNVIQQGYDHYWLHKLAGVGLPKPSNTGVSVNLRSDQPGNLSYRTVSLTEGGLAHLRTNSGCVFDYRLLAPAVLLGLEWPKDQPAESATAVLKANINQTHPFAEPGFATSSFLGRPVSATDWQVLVFAGAPEAGLPDLDLQQLTDIELNFSTTYASRQPSTPQPSECTRIDY